MRGLDLIRRHPLWTSAALGGVVGTLVGLFLPIRAPERGPAQDAEWRLPTLAATRAYTDEAAASARGASYWGAQSQQGRREVQRATWVLKAIATRPAPGIAIAHGNGNEIVWVSVRGTLPDGGVLVGVDGDNAWFERDGCRFSRSLYASGADAASDSCASESAAATDASPNSMTSEKTKNP